MRIFNQVLYQEQFGSSFVQDTPLFPTHSSRLPRPPCVMRQSCAWWAWRQYHKYQYQGPRSPFAFLKRDRGRSAFVSYNRKKMYYILMVGLMACLRVQGQECLNEYGEPVDWFYMYKMPKMQQPNDFYLRKGLGYIFLTSKHPTADWRLGMKSINDSKSIIGNVLAPLYNKTISENLFHIMYNDDPPSSQVSIIYGHTKGVIVSDGKKGIWIVHSCPKFPIEPFTEIKQNKTDGPNVVKVWNSYRYPESATKFGQSLLCINLGATDLNRVGNLLMYNRPKIYSVNIPDGMGKSFPNLTLAAKNEFIKKGPWHYKTTLTTIGGSKFTGYAKAKQFEKDLYSAFIAPDVQSDLEVETWMNGPGDIPSDCKGNFTVKNVLSVGIRMEQNVTYRFKSSQDHSKWAVSNKDKSVICVGDINRMETQLKRGGGSVCFQHPYIWSRYKRAVIEVEPCPKRQFP